MSENLNPPQTSGKNDSLEGVVSQKSVDYSRANSRLGAIAAVITSIISLVALVGNSYISRSRNHVSGIPIGEVWEYPMVHWMNTPDRYEEDAKPLHLTQKFIRGYFEVDPFDFSSATTEKDFSQVKLSNRIAELLAYTIPGSTEHRKINTLLEKSQTTFKMYSDCKCVKRFLISDMMFSQPPSGTVRVEVLGRFVIFGQDGRRPVSAIDLGIKSIVLYLRNDLPLFDRETEGDTEATSGPKSVNPEGWYVVSSRISTISQKDLEDIRLIRNSTNMKGAY